MNKYTKGQVRYADLIFILGQSNAVGQGQSALSLPTSWRGLQPHINVYWEGTYSDGVEVGHFEKMIPMYNSKAKSSGGFGVEQSLAQLIHAQTLNEVYIVKSAVGGQPISSFMSPGGLAWGELQGFVTNSLAWLTARGIIPRVRAIIWLQGETTSSSSTFEADLIQVMSDVRGLSSTYLSNTPWIAAKLRSDVSTGAASYVNPALVNIAASDPNFFLIDHTSVTNGLFDGLHFADQGYINIGQKFFESMVTNNLLY